MIVKRIVKLIDGNIEATLMLTGEQAAFLMNVGLGALVQRGAATLLDFTPEEYEEHTEEEKRAEAEAIVAMPINVPTPATNNEPVSAPSETTVAPIEPSKEGMKKFLESVDIDSLHKA